MEEAVPFRNKDRMKQVLSAAGVRTPRHALAETADACREAARSIGYPLILKPIAGAGSTDTHRVDDAAQLEAAIAQLGHLPEVNVEEFIDGEEYTFDTVCVDVRSSSTASPGIARVRSWRARSNGSARRSSCCATWRPSTSLGGARWGAPCSTR